MNKWYLSFICLFSTPYAMASLDLATGISLSTLNGEVIDNAEDAVLTTGENQLVLDYTGYLSDQGKREFISTVPYIMVVNVPENAEVEVDLQTRKYAKIAKNVHRRTSYIRHLYRWWHCRS